MYGYFLLSTLNQFHCAYLIQTDILRMILIKFKWSTTCYLPFLHKIVYYVNSDCVWFLFD